MAVTRPSRANRKNRPWSSHRRVKTVDLCYAATRARPDEAAIERLRWRGEDGEVSGPPWRDVLPACGVVETAPIRPPPRPDGPDGAGRPCGMFSRFAAGPGWLSREVSADPPICGTLAGTGHDRRRGEIAMAFAAEHDVPIPYMQRTRDYYLKLGYANPYRWAHFDEVPFAPLTKPLAEARLALITTAAPYQPGVGDQGPGAAYNAAAKFYEVYSDSTAAMPDLRISHVGYDRKHTTGEDPNAFFPLVQLQEAVKAGRLGAVTPRFHGAPTNRSHRVTLETDAPELLRRCREDGADVALLAPN
jgi:hypothetical protein